MKNLGFVAKYAFKGMAILAMLGVVGCAGPEQIKKAIDEDPTIVFKAIEKDPKGFMDAFEKAYRAAEQRKQEDEGTREKARLEEEFKNPLKPKIDENRVIFGNKDAKITIVEYSDFQCPYCSRATLQTVHPLMKEYPNDVRIIFKHLPLDFHPQAMPAAKMFEAIAKQDHEKARKFHDEVFAKQKEMGEKGEPFMKEIAKKLGADIKQLEKDMNSKEVMDRINADIAEAQEFRISGTPGFIINGVSLRGAYPIQNFKEIIDRQLKSMN